jgi:hypothetical protein
MDNDEDLKNQVNINDNLIKGRFDPTKIALEENFSLLKFSSLKG